MYSPHFPHHLYPSCSLISQRPLWYNNYTKNIRDPLINVKTEIFMTRKIQKNREIDLVKIFLSAFEENYQELNLVSQEDEENCKSDVFFQYENHSINFQIKEIHFHPSDKKPYQYSDEAGLQKALEKGKKNTRTHVYDYEKSPWQTAVLKTIQTASSDYKDDEKIIMDLLILMNDSSLPSDSSFRFPELKEFGFRSISLILYRDDVFSTILYAKDESSSLFKINFGKQKKCQYRS